MRNRDLRDRCTVYLDPAVNQQLDFVARVERRQRSEVVTDILRRYLPKYQIKRG
jgi:metal-responsive CopG/Arc/MetJ family transcriptional regulator